MMTSYDTNAQIDWNLTSGKNMVASVFMLEF